jgi:molybdopterin-containing oxidoreductase family membrane subunit
MHLRAFLLSALRSVTSGDRRYHLWMGSLTAIMLGWGPTRTSSRPTRGLIVTGMNNHVRLGTLYLQHGVLVGVAAAAVILVMPAYVLHDVASVERYSSREGVAVVRVGHVSRLRHGQQSGLSLEMVGASRR